MTDSKKPDTGADLYWNYAAGTMDHAQNQADILRELAALHGAALTGNARDALNERWSDFAAIAPALCQPHAMQDLLAYWRDAAERWVLTLDTLCQRGDGYVAREAEGFSPVLAFDYEMVVDGRTLERPANYALVRILPPEGFPPGSDRRRPWVIIDPRAGHGSGIGGFKSESEVGEALRDGHPVYFVIFFPHPEPGQTLADVCAAEATFLRAIRERHPNSSKPLVTGNCQGGWASMILAATHPDLVGPVIVAGAPLSYWAGIRGRNPFRYLAGLEGGAVPALLSSDLGAGEFDGATLIFNFEQLNPGKTWWRKNYDLFANVDKDTGRFLDFERWWSGFYFMNEAEIRWIVENLFIGNKLTRGEAFLNDGTHVDLKRIEAPVVVFASHGDNITPPQQALAWIADLYPTVQDLKAQGRVIIYTLHDSIGHLGIFVSAQVANKQHKVITSVVKTIESLPPGLYEMLIGETADGTRTVRFEARTIDDVRQADAGRNEDAPFAAVARLSEWAVKSYEVMLRPMIRALVTPEIADALRRSHPMRQQHYFFSAQNPLFADIRTRAAETRAARTPAAKDHPFLQLERLYADWVEDSLNVFRDARDACMEMAFYGLYASPWTMRLGLPDRPVTPKHDVRALPQVQAAVRSTEAGGYPEAIVRMLILVDHARGSVRRDRLEQTDRLLHTRPPFDTMTPEQRGRLIYEQNMVVEFAGDHAIATLPVLLKDEVDRFRAVNLVFDIVGPVEDMDAPSLAMFKKLQSALYTLAQGWREPKRASNGRGSQEAPPTNAGMEPPPLQEPRSDLAGHGGA